VTNSSTGGGVLEFYQVSTPSAPSSNSARIYSKDVSGTAEMFVMDEAGNETQISPHNHNAPPSLIDDAYDEIGYSANYYTGIVTWTNRDRELAGKQNARQYETFDEYNTRLGLSSEKSLVQLDWDEVQLGHVSKREEDRLSWLQRKTAWEEDDRNSGNVFAEPEPEVLTAKPKPQWLIKQLAQRDAFLLKRSSRLVLYPEAEMYQIHDWMYDNGLDPDNVPQIINNAFPAGVERKKALSRWNKAVRVPRDHHLVNLIGSLMTPPLTPEQIDAAWDYILVR
jgi:hypothetical protein